jgi:hypothetical protein
VSTAPLHTATQLAIPTFIVVPVGPPTLPKVINPSGVIAPYTPLPSAAAPASTPPPATPAATTTTPALLIPASATPSGGGGGTGGGAGATAFLGVALAAGFIGAVELRDRRRTA